MDRRLFCLALPLILALYLRWIRISRSQRKRCILNRPGDIQRLLSPKTQQQIVERAKANERLVHAFGLNNAFTTQDVDHHAKFRKLAISAAAPLGNGDDGFASIEVVDESIHRLLNTQDWHSCNTITHPLSQIVQQVTFCTVFGSIFGVKASDMNIRDVNAVTTVINELWCQSKGKLSQGWDSTALQTVNAIQAQWLQKAFFPTEEAKELSQNPLDIIIPAYETLWRVVANAILVSYAMAELRPGLLHCYEKHYMIDRAMKVPDPPEVTSKAIMSEVLRLYPPTRRISRVVEGPKDDPAQRGLKGLVALDVEALHRLPSTWGSDALVFDPARFKDGLSPEQNAVYIPFGDGKLKCPARKWAPDVAAIIAGAILYRDEIIILPPASGWGDLNVVDGGRKGLEDWRVVFVTKDQV